MEAAIAAAALLPPMIRTAHKSAKSVEGVLRVIAQKITIMILILIIVMALIRLCFALR